MASQQPVSSQDALSRVWRDAGLDGAALDQIDLPDQSHCLPTSFHVGTAAQASVGAAALAAESLFHLRSGNHQEVRVDKTAAELECTGYFRLDDRTPNAWEKLSGLYETRDGHVRIHANFEHHRDGVLRLLGLPGAERTERDDVVAALSQWSAEEFESAAAEEGLVVAMVRSFEAWDAHPHAIATVDTPLVSITRIDEARTEPLPPLTGTQRPLSDLRVLDLTRILAGPICGRTLAAYGADVMLINSPFLPNIAAITDTSRGKRSAHVDLRQASGVATFKDLLRDAHVFVQGYRPGALSALGFDPVSVAALRPGIVCVSLSAYGNTGPWSQRRGFDSLVQTATGFNHAEALAAHFSTPKALPVQILDYASGFLMAFGAQAALLRQAAEGGSWHVEISLLNTATWLRSLGRLSDGFDVTPPAIKEALHEFPCDEGVLQGMPHAATFSQTAAMWARPSALPGAHEPRW